ncbi:AAA family ATPase [Selenomonas sp. KH1T6]|uniref:AAA family ATPase n=1 Tax=Selenomonas sp. KH1T6 TaxID=3158784 RepID=UPI0008A781D3|nr:PD-(D/E)XK nuclease superfamily protein [Selenomonas ruminantium]
MQTNQKPMPVGIEDFRKLVKEGYYFIDKTGFIKGYIDAQVQVTLITRPRRFGKTLTLSMLRYFFDVEKAEENRELFRGLVIEQAGERYMKEQGSRPVVFFTLKDIRMDTWKDELEKMALGLSKLYRNYLFLLESTKLTEVDREAFRAIWEKRGSLSEMEEAVANLCHMLELHYGRPPVLLLDEYDAPILAAWEKGYYNECIGFMRNFLGAALKTNPSLGFAVLTGVARISKESIFSGLNNLEVCSVLSDRYDDAFGFTQEEVNTLMMDSGVEDRLTELKQWYDGYRFGSAELYNPWSVINFVQNGCKFQPYWLNVSGNSILRVLLENVDEDRRKELEGLMQGVPVEATIDEGGIYTDIRESSNALYMMLLTTGYLKAVEAYWDPLGQELPCCKLLIPNLEIRIVYQREILGWLATRSDSIQLRNMLRAMVSGDAATFQNRLQKLLAGIVSYHDAARNPENFYHGMLLGFSVLMSREYRVASNRESGYGRFDIAFFPFRENVPGVILELKAAKTEDELEAKAKDALQQIEEKEYSAEFSRQGVKNIWKYGIAFQGKKVWLEGGA